MRAKYILREGSQDVLYWADTGKQPVMSSDAAWQGYDLDGHRRVYKFGTDVRATTEDFAKFNEPARIGDFDDLKSKGFKHITRLIMAKITESKRLTKRDQLVIDRVVFLLISKFNEGDSVGPKQVAQTYMDAIKFVGDEMDSNYEALESKRNTELVTLNRNQCAEILSLRSAAKLLSENATAESAGRLAALAKVEDLEFRIAELQEHNRNRKSQAIKGLHRYNKSIVPASGAEQKERSPNMLKTVLIAAGVLAIGVPLAVTQVPKLWVDAYASVTPVELTDADQLAALEQEIDAAVTALFVAEEKLEAEQISQAKRDELEHQVALFKAQIKGMKEDYEVALND